MREFLCFVDFFCDVQRISLDPTVGEHDADFLVFWCFGVLVISRGARRIGFDSDTGRCRCELCGVGAQRIELDPKGRERTMRAVMDDVSVSFDAQRIDLDPRDWGIMMRAVGGCLSVPTDLSQFLELE